MRFIHFTRTAKSAKAVTAVTLLGALGILAAASLALTASGNRVGFKLAATPASQTVTQGGAATYGIAIDRDNKFTSPVSLSTGTLPAGTSAAFSPSTIPGSSSTASLSVTTSSTTPTGTHTLTITATGSNGPVTTTVSLVVVSPAQANFTLTGSPSSRVLSADDSVSYAIAIERNNFDGLVSLSATGVPTDLDADFSPAGTSGSGSTLTITSDDKPKPGTYTLTVTGTGGGLTRSTAVSLTVEEKRPFQISGSLPSSLVPGQKAELDLLLTNPHNFALSVTDIGVAVDNQTSGSGCSGSQNFSVNQIPANAYPITLPANSSQTLSQLGAPRPEVAMNDLLTTNQDACKAVAFDLHYSGLATK